MNSIEYTSSIVNNIAKLCLTCIPKDNKKYYTDYFKNQVSKTMTEVLWNTLTWSIYNFKPGYPFLIPTASKSYE